MLSSDAENFLKAVGNFTQSPGVQKAKTHQVFSSYQLKTLGETGDRLPIAAFSFNVFTNFEHRTESENQK